MNKIYDKLLLVISLIILAGGIFLYMQASESSEATDIAVNETPADNPYVAKKIPEPQGGDANWPEAGEQSTGWLYDVFTPPQIFIDTDGRFSIVPITPPPPPVPFGVYLAEIRRNLYRLQLEGYIEEDTSDASKTLLLLVDEETQTQVRARPGDTKPDHDFEVRGFTIERIRTDDGGINKVGTATIYDQRLGEEIELVHDEELYDSGITVVIRSNEDPSVDIELTEAPSKFETPSGKYILEQISLEDSSVTVKKQGTEEREAETAVLSVETPEPDDSQAEDPEENPEEASDDADDAFDSLF